MAELTPMMQQYFEIKNKNKDFCCFTVWATFTSCFLMMQSLSHASLI